MEKTRVKQHERLYFDTLLGGESFIEVDWNNSAFDDDMVKIEIVGKGKIVVRREELETYLLAFTLDPSRYMEDRSRKIGIKYVPVPHDQYQKYMNWKKWEERHKNAKV